MGLRDILTGMQNGPRGQPQPSSGGGGGGMSPIVIALLGLLAYKAYKGRGGQAADAGGAGQTARLPQGGTAQPGNAGGGLGDVLGGLFGGKPAGAPAGTTSGGNLGDVLKGGLGGLLGGAAAGSVLSGGLGNLIKGFQDSGAWSCRGVLGWHRSQQGDCAQRPGRCARERYARHAEPADRHGTKRAARGASASTPGLRRSAHAARPDTDRRRSVPHGLMRAVSLTALSLIAKCKPRGDTSPGGRWRPMRRGFRFPWDPAPPRSHPS